MRLRTLRFLFAPSFNSAGSSSSLAAPFLCLAFLLTFCVGQLHAQSASTGVLRGRVFNPATKEYVRNAEVRVEGTPLVTYTEDGGTYQLIGVPAGDATIVVNYTGTRGATQHVTIAAGQTVTEDLELQGLTVSSGPAPAGEKVIQLAAFEVSAERDGQAKAIMQQRAAVNAKNVVASDNYGDLTMGDVGEFLKYMPGISLDYLEVDTSGVRIGGLDPKYSNFTQDGARMASSDPGFGGASRRNTFEQMSITGIESVEFNNTLTANMDADSPGGSINLRSKNAFERSHRAFVFQAYAMGTSDAITLRREYLPDDRKHYKVFPAGQIGYADVFFNHRLGIEVNASYNASFVQQDRVQMEYNYTNPEKPVVTGIMWRPGPKVTSRTAANFSLDFKLTPELVFSWRSSYSLYEVEFFNQYTWLRANPAQISADSTLTDVTAAATNNANTRLGTEYSHRHNYQPNYLLAPKLEYKGQTFTATLRGSYSSSRTSNRDMDDGFFRNTNDRITRMSWAAERASEDSPTWNVRQLSGPDWSVPENWGSRDTHANNIVSNADETKAEMYSGYFDFKKQLKVGGVPLELLTGLGARTNDYHYVSGNQQWTLVGPTGVQTQTYVPYTQHYKFNIDLDGKAGNVNSLNWRADDTYATYRLYQEHPEYFKPDELGNFSRVLTGLRDLKEEVDAAYIEGNTRIDKLRLNAGLRYERTSTTSPIYDPRSKAELIAAGYPVSSTGVPTTKEGYLYQYRNGERTIRKGEYDNLFLSGGAKYLFTRDLHAQLAMSESILRPDYQNLAGITTINEDSLTVTVPNPSLKPELSTKYFAGLQYYFEPAGVLSASVFRLKVKNQLSDRIQLTPEQAGLDPDQYPGYTILGYLNGSGMHETDGITLDYNQQLTFLPGFLKGLSVFGSVTRVIADTQQFKLPNKSANGGIRFRYGRFNTQIRATWQAASLISYTVPLNEYLWLKERTLVDLSAGYKLTQNLELMLSVRNIFNAPSVQYSNVPGRVQLYDVYGSLWNLGIKGSF
ncbi:MAG TPA: TonB-dependent receptor [Opitutaceae bacterium]|nr:TonB-dependent receptor [Opitutaceae bacterium]